MVINGSEMLPIWIAGGLLIAVAVFLLVVRPR